MGDILALGLTHYPPIMGPDEDMDWVLRWTLEDPDIPPRLKDPAAWPEPMRAEWGSDEGRTGAAAHRAGLVEGFRRVRAALDEFDPDFVLFWGDDQYENFTEDCVPPFALLAYDELEGRPWAKPGRDKNVWGESPDTTFRYRGAGEAGRWLAGALLERHFDVAYSYKPLHYEGLSHSFLNALLLLDYDRVGFPWPVLPMPINCYGRRVISFKGGRSRLADAGRPFDPPSPMPARCFELGAATAAALAASPWRVAVVASSSWSHAFLTDHTWRLHADVEADRELYEALVRGDYDQWRRTTLADVERAGQQEILNWFCLAGAAEHLGVKPTWSSFVETYVFNSNKVFAVYPPVPSP
jgi:hypothetical protein